MLVPNATFSASGLAAQAMFDQSDQTAQLFGATSDAPGIDWPEGTDGPLSVEGFRAHRVTERVRMLITNQRERPEARKSFNEVKAPELPEGQQPKAVAKRILDFIRAMSGGDPGMLDLLTKAAEQGFKEAESIFGGRLPDVSYETMDLVRQGFEDMLAEFTGPGQGPGDKFGPAATIEFTYEREVTTLEYFSYTAQAAPAQAAAGVQPAAAAA